MVFSKVKLCTLTSLSIVFSYRKQTRVDNKVAILDSKFLTS